MATSATSKSTPRKPRCSEAVRQAGLADYLLARAPAEDVAAYDPAVLDKAAALAHRAVSKHRKGESVVAIDTDEGVDARTAVR